MTTEILTVPADPRAVHALYGKVADAVRGGHLAIIPTDTSYAVIADAFTESAVTAVREARRHEPDVPLPVGVGSLDTAHGVAVISGLALDLVSSCWPGAVTLLTRPQPSLTWDLGPADAALALRMPGHTVALGVLERVGPVVMANAAVAGEPAATTVAAALASLGQVATLAVDVGELPGTQSSVVDATSGNLRLLREGVLPLAALRDIVPMLVRATA